jgi:hypothetical protein
MDSSTGYLDMTPGGFPHSEIPGSKRVCRSPRLIAAYHVLHRLLTPRHPPSALSSLISARSRALVILRLADGEPSPHAGRTSAFTRFVCLGLSKIGPKTGRHLKLDARTHPARDASCIVRTIRSASSSLNRVSSSRAVVELTGIEPVTPGLQSRCSPD